MIPGNQIRSGQRPLAVVPAQQMREVYAYVERLRAKAAEHRRLAAAYDELADNSQPVDVVLPVAG